MTTDLLIYATAWGWTDTFDALCAKAKAAGYDGIECLWLVNPEQRAEQRATLRRHGLEHGTVMAFFEPDFAKHRAVFEANLERAARDGARYVNLHAGHDFFTFEQGLQLVDIASRIARESGATLGHETHRGRLLYECKTAQAYLNARPELRVTLDISHWCNVHEGLLRGFEPIVEQTLARVDHVHARIGHAQGPQVNDPRAPEWAGHVAQHLAWWDVVVARRRAEGRPVTFHTEFGPVDPGDYMPSLPGSRQPVADQWAINLHMLQLLRSRYG